MTAVLSISLVRIRADPNGDVNGSPGHKDEVIFADEPGGVQNI
jgi:hypothetical protein